MPPLKSPLGEYVRVLLTLGLALPFWLASSVRDLNSLSRKYGPIRSRLPSMILWAYALAALISAYVLLRFFTHLGPGVALSQSEFSVLFVFNLLYVIGFYAVLIWLSGEIKRLHPNPPSLFRVSSILLMFAFYLGVGYLQAAMNEIPRLDPTTQPPAAPPPP